MAYGLAGYVIMEGQGAYAGGGGDSYLICSLNTNNRIFYPESLWCIRGVDTGINLQRYLVLTK